MSANAQGSEPSWWMLCDTCVTDGDFQLAAMSAPSPYEAVYVSNKRTIETRLFSRVSVMEDWGDGLQQLTTVSPLYLGADDEAVFSAALVGATESEIVLERGELVGLTFGYGSSSSVVGDLEVGPSGDSLVVDAGWLIAIRNYVKQNNLLPDNETVSRQAGIEIKGKGGNVGVSKTIRTDDLTIVVTYQDGSTLRVVRDGETGEYVSWSMTDADGNVISLAPNSNGVGAVSPGFFLNQSFEFDADHYDEVIDLSTFITANTSGSCHTTTTTRPDGTDVIRVTCIR
jgi:hypothetical protein